MPHSRSAGVRAANAEPDTQTRDLFVITLPDPTTPITFHFATGDVTVGAQFYEGRIRSTPQLGYSSGSNQDGGQFTIENLTNDYGPIFMSTNRVLDGGTVIVYRAWRLADGTWEILDAATGLYNELMRGTLRTQPVNDNEVQCNIVSDTSDPTVEIGGEPIFQHCDKFYNKNENHVLGGPCGWKYAMLGFQFETAMVIGTITGSGNAQIIVTAAGMTGNPITLNVPVVAADTDVIVAGKLRVALLANANIVAWFNVKGEGADIQLSTKVKAAQDLTMNISIANGTCTGLTFLPFSEHTSRIFCDKTLEGPQGCLAKGNTRHGGIPQKIVTDLVATPDAPGGIGDPNGGYGPGSGFHRPPKLDPDIRMPFMP